MMTFEQAKALIHRRLDGEPLSEEQRVELERFLKANPDAQALADELSLMQGALSALDVEPFPEHALNEVLEQTVAGRSGSAPSDANGASEGGRSGVDSIPVAGERSPWGAVPRRWMSAAAAVAAMALVAVGAWWFQPAEPEPTPEDVARQLEMVFKTTSDAIDRTAIQSVEDLFSDEVSPALRKIPLLFEGAEPAPTGEES